MKTLFYSVRRIERGPRGGLRKVEIISNERSRPFAISEARSVHGTRSMLGFLPETDVVPVALGKGKAFIVGKPIYTSKSCKACKAGY